MLISANWPSGEGLDIDAAAEQQFELIQGVVGAVRSVRALTMVGERKPLRALVCAPRDAERGVLAEHGASAKALGFLETFDLRASAARPPSSACAVHAGVEVFVELGADVDLDKLRGVLTGRREKLDKSLQQLDGKLSNANFVERADPDVVATERARRDEMLIERDLLARNLAGL